MKLARLYLVVVALLPLSATVFAGEAAVGENLVGQKRVGSIRGEVIINRADGAWESQQVQEPCILPNPKDSGRLIMFYSGVPTSNRVFCAVGKAWAVPADPFTWHQDSRNPIFSPSASGWDSKTLRLDCVLYIPEEDAYYIYYS